MPYIKRTLCIVTVVEIILGSGCVGARERKREREREREKRGE